MYATVEARAFRGRAEEENLPCLSVSAAEHPRSVGGRLCGQLHAASMRRVCLDGHVRHHDCKPLRRIIVVAACPQAGPLTSSTCPAFDSNNRVPTAGSTAGSTSRGSGARWRGAVGCGCGWRGPVLQRHRVLTRASPPSSVLVDSPRRYLRSAGPSHAFPSTYQPAFWSTSPARLP